MDELSSICAGLGIVEEDDNGKRIGYTKGEYCLDSLKDLLRFLRRDDPEKRDVFKQICKWSIVGKDLIPIMEYYQEDRNLVLNSVKLLVFLTMPVEPTSTDISQQIEYLWGLKSAITFSNIVPVMLSLLESPLENLENESFTEDDWKLVQLVLTLFRNILAIQDISTQQKAGGSATQFLFLRDKFLELLFQENVMDLILVLSQHTGGSQGYLRQDNLLLLENFYHIFRGQDPELVAKAYLKGSKVEEDAENPVTSLQSIMKEEQEKRKLTRFHNLSCYSQFSGTYTRVTLDGSKALLKGNPSASVDSLLKAHKNRGPSKREIWDHRELPPTKNKILHLLDDFVSQFLMGGYNVLMRSICEDIDKEHQEIQNSDVMIFFWVAQFVMSFQYHKSITSKPSIDAENVASVSSHDDNTLFKGSICGPIAETLNESMFLMVIAKWRTAFEALKCTKEYKFLSAAGSLAKIMIRMLDLVLKQSPEDSREPQTARVLLYKLFYDQTDEGTTQFLLNLIRSFDTHKQSKSDLANLVETMHVVLRLLETLQARGTLRVSKKSRKKRKKAMAKNEDACEPTMDNVNPQKEVGGSICQEPVIANMLGKEKLTNQDFDIEGDTGIKDSIQVDDPVQKPGNSGCNDSGVDDINIDNNDGLYPETDGSTGDEQILLADEVDFRVSSLVSALANNNIIQKLCWLLKFYKSNSITTNHYVLSMLQRICDDLDLAPMLYQLSFLTIFYDILEEQKARPCKEYENIVTFLTSVIRRMLRKMKSYPLLFVEVLFPKTRKECHYINCESMLNDLKGIRKEAEKGRSGTKNGVSGFFEDQRWVQRNIADALGDDDYDISYQGSQKEMFRQSTGEGNETSISILNKEFDGSGISDREAHFEEESVRSSKRGNRLFLSDEVNGRLKDLYEKYKDNVDCCKLIAGDLDPNGGISKMQASKMLKKLGYKVPAKAKMQKSDASNEIRGSKKDPSNDASDPNLTLTENSSSLRKPEHSRKRVHAFSVDQEQKIKELFEQFKDKKKCSHLIATALDDNGTISAARVSRKLKQLGLVVPKNKRPNAKMQLTDEVLSDISADGADKSDDETLLSMRIRGKQKRRGSPNDEAHNKKVAQKSSEDISDDELLSSVFVKTKKMSSTTDAEETKQMLTKGNVEELVADASENNIVETKSVESDTQVIERDGFVQSDQIEMIESFDELADFDEDMEPANRTEENGVLKRRKRMVVDLEDDEE